MSPDKEIIPYRYIIKFSKNKLLKIGRGLDMNLILNDLSISRNHCQLEISDNGDILLKDNN
jgi:pSer/pThr/pTyr-binding forkhead associated (FHA) protein